MTGTFDSTERTPLPKLVFFRWLRPDQPPFLLDQLGEHVACLKQFFDVELIDYPCDYAEICDRFEPDVALFESGIYAGPRSITNTAANPHIPKLGFLNADAFDPVRATFISDMADWGVETFFTMSVAMGEYTPEIADRLFVWPNFIDPTMHRDYELPKVVPVLLIGSQSLHYPWRNAVSRIAAQYFPTLTTPHFGWGNSPDTHRLTTGADYARMINASLLTPTCGSVSRDVVRKHFEIPASRSCLVTERTESIQAAGYRDMINCVFADEADVLDKIDSLLADPDRLRVITGAGYDLVHERHKASDRRQIRDWFDLRVLHGPSARIVQPGPFSALQLATAQTVDSSPVVISGGHDRIELRQAWAHVAERRYVAATRSFDHAATYYFTAETRIGRAYVHLLEGQPEQARTTINVLLERDFEAKGASEPDPVQWAMLVRTLLCLGAFDRAWRASRKFERLVHPELARIRWAAARLSGSAEDASALAAGPDRRASINPLPERSWPEWADELARMTEAAGQTDIAAIIREWPSLTDPATMTFAAGLGTNSVKAATTVRAANSLTVSQSIASRLQLARFSPAELKARARTRLNGIARRRLGAEWMRLVFDVAERDEVQRAIIVGSSRFSLRERSVRNALRRNPKLPQVSAAGRAMNPIDDAARFWLADRRGPAPAVDPSELAVTSSDSALVYLGRAASLPAELADALRSARIVIVDGVSERGAAYLVTALVDSGDFEIVAHHARPNDGYAVLRHFLGGLTITNG